MKSFSRGHIDSIVKSPDRQVWRFTGFCGNLKKYLHHHYWELIRRLQGFQGLPLTWLDPPDNVQKHLDRCLKSIDWMESFGGARVFHRDFFGSDHRVLHVVLDFASVLDDSLGTRQFILEPLWRSNDTYRDVVMQSWCRGRINGDGPCWTH
ncbi:hypothetical protein TIFTF001_028780 [Ficus carica]|uniref:Uncharacterized protein n=1 Tax=Ficus carica TaxID=3494 RepID=A0AA88DQL3_FICCA|nr:hypothetical protein TIFTF001_028780 [Ficus carica]